MININIHPNGDETGDHMIIMESADNGHSWADIRALTDYAQPHGHLLKLRDGRLLCCYASYNVPYGPVAMFSNDDGKTWDFDRVVEVYNPGRRIGGRGWPRTVQIDGDTLGTLFYDLSTEQPDGPGLYVVRTQLAALAKG